MNETETDNVEVQRLRDLKKTYDTTVKTRRQTMKKLDQFPTSMGQCLDSLRMKLNVPVSETQAEDAYHALMHGFMKLSRTVEPVRTDLTTELKTQVTKEREVLTECDAQYKVVDALKILGPIEMTSYPTLLSEIVSTRSGEDRSRFVECNLDNLIKVELDAQVRKLGEGQPKEIQQKLLALQKPHQLVFSRVKRKQVLMLKTRPNEGSLPPEIMVMIYSACDLETCYDLRQVNSSWYNGFLQVPKSTWKEKLRYRNPWMLPDDGELTSYAECVLKFVGRLKTWIPVDSIDDLEITIESPAQIDCIIAEPLKKNEKLPESFTNMFDNFPGQCSRWCEHVHGRHGFLDLTTLEYARNPIFEDYSDVKQVSMGPCGTVFHTYDKRAIIIPVRERTIEWDHRSLYGHIDDFIHLQHVFIARNGPSGTGIGSPSTLSYRIADFQNRQMVQFSRSECVSEHMVNMPDSPVASYNGLVWWSLERRCLMPTFLDLQQPGKIYHNPNRAIQGPELLRFYQGSLRSGSERFVVGNSVANADVHIYDLDTGKVTAVLGTKDCYYGEVLLGYEDGHFKPRCISPGDTEAYKEEVNMALREEDRV